ncbi:NPC intracellular cholesterol transporter 2 [Aplysia californica]|uniref:NPC intracellular cholesterol transporter 2 n=1 Tax=Aplysia californica TaxID=6500 RepID=A0ABM0ZZF5_APLCA|nr:NPC intracellular cholesterol transporter 2 [Aplysia californica]
MMSPVFVFLAVACVATLADNVPFKDCGSKLAAINSVDVTPCPQIPCKFERGKNVTISMKLTPNSAVSKAKTKVYGVIAGVEIPFPLADENACHDMTCPLVSGTAVTYGNYVNVLKAYPPTNVYVKWELQTETGDMITCFTIPVQIV